MSTRAPCPCPGIVRLSPGPALLLLHLSHELLGLSAMHPGVVFAQRVQRSGARRLRTGTHHAVRTVSLWRAPTRRLRASGADRARGYGTAACLGALCGAPGRRFSLAARRASAGCRALCSCRLFCRCGIPHCRCAPKTAHFPRHTRVTSHKSGARWKALARDHAWVQFTWVQSRMRRCAGRGAQGAGARGCAGRGARPPCRTRSS